MSRLAVAWTYDTGEKGGGFRGWSVTPLVIDNVMYFGTYAGKLVALNAETGAELWKFDLKTISPSGRYSPRGISYWPGDAQTPPRVVATTTDGLLTQVNAKNGELVRIGEKGYVDLKIGVTEKFGGGYNVAAPPAIFKDIAILAPTTGEQGRYGIPGDIRGFDLRTGKELWRFHTVPQPGEANFGTWGADGWQDRRGPGSWVNMTVDIGERSGLHPDGTADGSEFRRQPSGIESVFEQPRGARRGDGQAEMVLPDDAPRHLRLGCECAAHVDRREQERHEDSRAGSEHQARADVHPRTV